MIARLAERQHGVVARRQLLAAGLTREASSTGYAPDAFIASTGASTRSAIACSHRGAVDGGRPRRRPRCGAEPSVRGGAVGDLDVGGAAGRHDADSRRQRPGITWHVANLPADEITFLAAIPVTTVPRTLLDLAAVLTPRSRARDQRGGGPRHTDPLSLPALLDRYPRRRGTAAIRAILGAGGIGAEVTRSELEERFLRFLAQRGLPRPELNVSIAVGGGFVEADCVGGVCA